MGCQLQVPVALVKATQSTPIPYLAFNLDATGCDSCTALPLRHLEWPALHQTRRRHWQVTAMHMPVARDADMPTSLLHTAVLARCAGRAGFDRGGARLDLQCVREEEPEAAAAAHTALQ